MAEFKVVSPFEPQGDQPQAIDTLANGVLTGDKLQVLLGVTGSGKTFNNGKAYRTRTEADNCHCA